jgi:competence protein ComGF
MPIKTHRIVVNKQGKSIDIGSVEEINKIRRARANARSTKPILTARQKLAIEKSLRR